MRPAFTQAMLIPVTLGSTEARDRAGSPHLGTDPTRANMTYPRPPKNSLVHTGRVAEAPTPTRMPIGRDASRYQNVGRQGRSS
jgi:hypothetical protein